MHASERNLRTRAQVSLYMSKNPLLNALSAMAYITCVASVLYYIPKTITPVDSLIVPIAFLSLFVLSTALMAYFFVYQPVVLLFENKPAEATRLFLATVLIFAGITGVMVSVWFGLSISLR